MTKDLEQRLQEALDAGSLSDELLQEVAGQPELEPMIELDAALRSMPRAEFDFSEDVLARLDEDFDEIPGLLEAPQFDDDESDASLETAAVSSSSSSSSSSAAASASAKTAPSGKPISLDDARRKRSAAPFLLSAAAVFGLVATGTLMTLNSSPDQMESASVAAPTATATEMPESYAAAEEMAPAPSEGLPEEERELAFDDVAADYLALNDQDGQLGRGGSSAPAPVPQAAAARRAAPTAASTEDSAEAPEARTVRMASPGAVAINAEATGELRSDEGLSASQRRTVSRVESCLPDHIRITRVRESTDGRRIVGVDTSEELSESVDECVSGVLDTFPRARRRRARRPATSMTAPTSLMTVD